MENENKSSVAKGQKASIKFASQNSQIALKLIMFNKLQDMINFQKKLIIILSAVLMVAFAIIAYQVTRPDAVAKYFTVDPAGRLTEVIPLSEPTLSRAGIGDWAADCVRSSYTFMFATYKEELTRSLQRCFTKEGIVKFKEQLNRIGVLEDIAKDNGANITQVDGVALIKKEGEIDGKKAYLIEVPVLISQKYPKKVSAARRWTVIITALRVDNTEYDKGMAIHVWNMEPRG
ncbi:DotI/IcmL/TraM family protein [Shewanella aestuarii]|uniref:Conjugal transfer protein n=1 Tax=Shewanella aestuarii TaxID=1028752 RepID=A0A6G9QR50_9GAMM|nr:DotI/IcmL/TraM family protein [Shewanella aestuarii]QIR16517.1 hypothetical protein HBH39_18750 [Shewanella aestuarii]